MRTQLKQWRKIAEAQNEIFWSDTVGKPSLRFQAMPNSWFYKLDFNVMRHANWCRHAIIQGQYKLRVVTECFQQSLKQRPSTALMDVRRMNEYSAWHDRFQIITRSNFAFANIINISPSNKHLPIAGNGISQSSWKSVQCYFPRSRQHRE
jgi:hypothetical protein